jgi:hypothetical protein
MASQEFINASRLAAAGAEVVNTKIGTLANAEAVAAYNRIYQDRQDSNSATARLSGAKVAANPTTQQNLFQTQLVAYQQEVRRRGENAANGAQEATVRYWVETKNAGTAREAPFQFSVAFLNEPHMTHGFAVAVNHTFGSLFLDPIGNATILQWVRNDRGHFIGVRMSYWADVPRRNPYVELAQTFDGKDKPAFLGIHHLSFTGTAYKAFTTSARTQIATVQPNPVFYGSDPGPNQPDLIDAQNQLLNTTYDQAQLLQEMAAKLAEIQQYYPGYPGVMTMQYSAAGQEAIYEYEELKRSLQQRFPKVYAQKFPNMYGGRGGGDVDPGFYFGGSNDKGR